MFSLADDAMIKDTRIYDGGDVVGSTTKASGMLTTYKRLYHVAWLVFNRIPWENFSQLLQIQIHSFPSPSYLPPSFP